jgi:hypothetical protein
MMDDVVLIKERAAYQRQLARQRKETPLLYPKTMNNYSQLLNGNLISEELK